MNRKVKTLFIQKSIDNVRDKEKLGVSCSPDGGFQPRRRVV